MARYGNNHKGGRPKSNATVIAQKMRERLVKKVKKDFDPLIDSQLDLAKGLAVQKTITIKGKKFDRYYVTKPNEKAAKNLIDQAIGRPQESLKVEGEIKTVQELVARLEEEEHLEQKGLEVSDEDTVQ